MTQKPFAQNTLFYGDNLPILREYIADESVDLIYLDPPFNSSRSYNVLFKDESGHESDAQITAFEDTWHWNEAAALTYKQLVEEGPERVAAMIGALHEFVGENPMMAYLTMMAARLVELHRVLKPTGSLYLHCDPTASHYLKIILDSIFGGRNFRNEIIWCYRKWSVTQSQFVHNHDVILFYSKSHTNTFNPQYVPVSEGTMRRWKGKKQQAVIEGGVRKASSLDAEESKTPMPDWWEISILNPASNERLGYPTQKPLALLERIISASSNEGDVVLDPFCGCGTAVAAAQALKRRWIGIDITHLAIALQKNRLKDMFDLKPIKDYRIIGEPTDIGSAKQLANEDRYQFQFWALSLVQARPMGGVEGSKQGKKGSDKGIDGVLTFIDDPRGKPKRALVQVKSGHVKSGDVRDLRGTLEREASAMGVFITLEPPTREMEKEAVAAGFYHSPLTRRDYPKLQIVTVDELLNGKEIKVPITRATFKQAGRIEQGGTQSAMELD